jgi:hypothetical protein
MSSWLDLTRVGTYRDGSPIVINLRTAAMNRRVEDRLGYPLTITQGGHHEGGVSGGTHLHMAEDLLPFDWERKVRALRLEGFAAWHRTPAQGFEEHVHAVPIDDPENAPGTPAWYQIEAYLDGFIGLGWNWRIARDDGPRFSPIPRTPLTKEDFVSYLDQSQKDRDAMMRDIVDAVWRTDHIVKSAAWANDHPDNPDTAVPTAIANIIDRVDRIESALKASP